MKLRITALVLLGMSALALGVPGVRAQANVVCEQDYTVTAGDWLSNIADKFYGDTGAYKAIFLATNLKAQGDPTYATLASPDAIEVGSKLCLPNKQDAEQLLNSAVTATPAATESATPTPTTAASPTPVSSPTVTSSAPVTPSMVAGSAATLTVSDVTFNPYNLAANIQGQVVPASAYDNSAPPGPVGAPAHVAFQFDGTARLWVIPTAAYQAQWDAAGNGTIARSIAQLRLLLRDRVAAPQLPLPFLPPVPATNDLAARVRYLDFDGGSGIAYLARWAQDPSPILASQIEYAFFGLTNDGKYIVSFRYPVHTSVLPDAESELTAEHLAEISANPSAYFVQTTDLLNKQSNSAFGPDLSRLDALVFSIHVPSTGSTLPPPAGALPTPDPSTGGGAVPSAPADQDATNRQRLLATDWKWLGTTTPSGAVTVDDPDKYGIRFNNANGFGITADCNIGAGNFVVSGSTLTIKDLQATLVYCGDTSLDRIFTAQLLQASEFSFQDNNLIITLKGDAGVMRFRR